MRHRLFVLIALFLVVAITASACQGQAGSPTPLSEPATEGGAGEQPTAAGDTGEQPATEGGAEATGKKATYVSTGPIGVNPFLQLIAEGLERGGEECGVETRVIESTDLAAMEDNLRAAIEEGNDLIVVNSFDSVDAVTRLSGEFPDQKWAIVDAGIENNDQVRGILFREHEGTFLIGAIMGRLTESNTVGFIGAMDIPLIRRWWVGFEEGVKHVNPEATVLENWVNSWNDPATSKELALTQAEQGADYIAGVAAAGNTGIFEAAKERGFFTSGVDTDQRPLDPEHIIESMVKRSDVGVHEAVCDVANDQFTGGFQDYGLKENGVGPAFLVLEDLEIPSTLPEEIQTEVRDLAEQIKSGELVVTDYLATQEGEQ
ncbi:MAG TPA: BMP family ABC transporter substrate-binding protein [Ardenticatenaceae bacterium]|nr:BMP family ABC transporter substrate-binding protein [Ardenticatenaceae bacterium]